MIDLRSDTVTKPTPAMRQAAFGAVVGDDVYEEDPTVLELEETAAQMLGKEAAMFVTSGTQGNQIAVLTHCRPGEEVILEAESHIYYYEGATISAFAGVQPRTIAGNRGAMDPQAIAAAIREDDIHQPETSLICLENTHNRAGGAVVPLENMQQIHKLAQERHISVHLDGARLFNAVVATGVDVKQFAACTDSVQICLSKGLGAPVGSLIAGSKTFIKKARKWRKRLGGGIRQAGIIAAPGLVALRTMVDRLVEDHANAKKLAEGLAEIKGLRIENMVETNMVMLHTKEAGMTAKEFVIMLKQQGILASAFNPYTVRLTTHFDVTSEEIDVVLKRVGKAMKQGV
ncbi:low-specificity L-threonine aldolase [Virgibacillus sp. 179-BFC.A HS]|uniref:Low-specificity L-threonine aldolase n=1 Tax=Tigheibacillus jepli TaxID=3035914 RepID=A0ABU5CFD3_9BACI|nr:low-specificity L-threonine aldolase [Virgibacillus sp. 179-BFC.A HS]MDY0404230.1 low-specificity L-threonine aldolase [Virgibacillus sp. 179-BFC.A HS]